MNTLSGFDNSGKPKQNYIDRISAMDMDQLKTETKNTIWLSGYANNNPRSDYHWHVDACYEELKKRTGDDKAYAECYNYVIEGL